MSNYMSLFHMDVITHTYPILDIGLTNLSYQKKL